MANGIYTNEELAGTLLVDLNNLLKEEMTGNYLNACAIAHQMTQKLVNLKSGIKADLDNKNAIIEQLKQELRNAGMDVKDHKPEEFIKKDGAE